MSLRHNATRAMRKGDRANLEEELADVFAWLASLATLEGIDMETACAKYALGCPKCQEIPCRCPEQPPEHWQRTEVSSTAGNQAKETT